ncbi:hypothetical protein QTO34_018526 [Cnephaeus nilssonii]|uniref:Uncharacterized protein n=1 Tax=Cnephaeus nilssonii TaxID=3371016 RepID=A0AA40LQ94_CNENI|nr:hypothetical protein QTO34_018526 [Eptesicus nilssonii]
MQRRKKEVKEKMPKKLRTRRKMKSFELLKVAYPEFNQREPHSLSGSTVLFSSHSSLLQPNCRAGSRPRCTGKSECQWGLRQNLQRSIYKILEAQWGLAGQAPIGANRGWAFGEEEMAGGWPAGPP